MPRWVVFDAYVVTIAEGVPTHDMLWLYHLARRRGCRLIGPNSFGVISPGKAKVGFMAHQIFSPGHVGIISRSATNCYETALLLSEQGIGQSTCVGMGGDQIPGMSFIDLLPLYEADPETRVVVMIGEIGGAEEEIAAVYIKEQMDKPVVAFIAGKNAPRERSMGHAGAIVSAGGAGSAQYKEKALIEAGVYIADSINEIVNIVKGLLSSGPS